MALGPGVGSLRWACTFHALGDANLTRRQPVFWWNMGLNLHAKAHLFKLLCTIGKGNNLQQNKKNTDRKHGGFLELTSNMRDPSQWPMYSVNMVPPLVVGPVGRL